MAKDKHLERIKAIKRVSRIDTGGPHGRAGIHADKKERRIKHMGTKEWLEEAEEEIQVAEEVELALHESRLNRDESGDEPTVVCAVCGGETPLGSARIHENGWIGECCRDKLPETE